MFNGVNPANFDSMSIYHEAETFNTRSVSNNSGLFTLLLQESLGGEAVSNHKDILTVKVPGSNGLARPASSELVDGLENFGTRLLQLSTPNVLAYDFLEESARNKFFGRVGEGGGAFLAATAYERKYVAVLYGADSYFSICAWHSWNFSWATVMEAGVGVEVWGVVEVRSLILS